MTSTFEPCQTKYERDRCLVCTRHFGICDRLRLKDLDRDTCLKCGLNVFECICDDGEMIRGECCENENQRVARR